MRPIESRPSDKEKPAETVDVYANTEFFRITY